MMMDLSKAFDYIIREVVVGLPLGSNPRTNDEKLKLIEDRLKGLSISDMTKKYVTEYLMEWDGVLEKLDLPKWVHSLLKLYHENCWVTNVTGP